MRLPPADAYLKIRHTLEEVNGIIAQYSSHLNEEDRSRVSPFILQFLPLRNRQEAFSFYALFFE